MTLFAHPEQIDGAAEDLRRHAAASRGLGSTPQVDAADGPSNDTLARLASALDSFPGAVAGQLAVVALAASIGAREVAGADSFGP